MVFGAVIGGWPSSRSGGDDGSGPLLKSMSSILFCCTLRPLADSHVDTVSNAGFSLLTLVE
jgi:hypothetical protein